MAAPLGGARQPRRLSLFTTSDAFDSLRSDPRFQEAVSIVRRRAGEIIRIAGFRGYR